MSKRSKNRAITMSGKYSAKIPGSKATVPTKHFRIRPEWGSHEALDSLVHSTMEMSEDKIAERVLSFIGDETMERMFASLRYAQAELEQMSVDLAQKPEIRKANISAGDGTW